MHSEYLHVFAAIRFADAAGSALSTMDIGNNTNLVTSAQTGCIGADLLNDP
ncbi:hypothetical protein D3C76_1816950 [compost metagenome]